MERFIFGLLEYFYSLFKDFFHAIRSYTFFRKLSTRWKYKFWEPLAQSDCWFFPSSNFFPLFSSSPRDSIAAHPARVVVFHCCERMQIAIPVPGPSINSNRINSSAVIVFCASQKTLYTRAASFCPATNNIRFIRTVAHVADFSSPTTPVFLWWWNPRSKIGPWLVDITSAIDHFIGNYRQRFASDVSAQRTASKKGLSNIASLIRRTECPCFITW